MDLYFRQILLRPFAVPLNSGRVYGDGNTISYAKHCSRPHDAVIRVYDAAGNVLEMHRAQRPF